MELVSNELATKLLEMLEKGTGSAGTTMTEVLNEFLNYMIFVEALSAARFLLVLFFAWLVRKAFKLFESSAEDQAKKDFIKGLSTLSIALVMSVGVVLTFNSFLSLGKVLLAPKVYMIEMAFDKVRSIAPGVKK